MHHPDYRKKQSTKQQQPSFFQSIFSSFTNFRYRSEKSISEIKQKFLEPNQEQKQKRIVIQGKQYQNRKQGKQVVKNIVWFSYRKGFKISQDYKSDVGWGCLIRVGQMALASALIRFFLSNSQVNKHFSLEYNIGAIIEAFSDFDKKGQQRYSLTQIIEIAKQFGHQPGEWFDMTKISYCLQMAQNKRPMRGSQNLQVVFCDQSINVPKLFKILLLKQCTCAKKNVVCEKCHSQVKPSANEYIATRNNKGQFQTFIYKSQSQQQPNMTKQKLKVLQQSSNGYLSSSKHSSKNPLWIFRNRKLKRDLMLLVLTRVCDDKDGKNVNSVNSAIFALLDLRICLGIMGGFPGKAIFVVGRQQSKLIYLNPHYVQQNQRIQSNKKQSYFCQQYLLTERTLMDPTMSFCFYIQTVYDLELLMTTIKQIQMKYPEILSIGFDYEKMYFNPKQYQQDVDPSEDYRSDFQFSI